MSDTLVNVLKTVDNINSAWDLGNSEMVAADSFKLAAQIAGGIVVESGLRTYSALDGLGRTLSLWRLDMAISGKSIAGHQALSALIAGEAVGKLIDYLRDLNLGLRAYDWMHPDENWAISSATNANFNAARNWTQPRDPLVLDLDGDGIEAIGINPSAPILFDHDGDGTKNATGWIKADDGIVVFDRNGNGLIDSGRELFGDNTILQNGAKAGQTAANGYEALADLDANGDGALNSSDAAYAQLRIWRDANQDGVSQAAELKTLAELGIASINVTGTASNVNLGNGNTQPFSGSFTRTNSTTGASGVAEVTGSLLLASNNFYREFTDDPVVTAAAAVLPQMGCSGWVRDLLGVMSPDTAAAVNLQAKKSNSADGMAATSYKNRSISSHRPRLARYSRAIKHVQGVCQSKMKRMNV